MKINNVPFFKAVFLFIVTVSLLVNVNFAFADGALPTNKRVLEIVKSHMFTEAKPGSQMLGLGSHVTGEKYKDPLKIDPLTNKLGTSDHDFRFIPSSGSSNQEAFEEWIEARNRITSAIREEFGDQADDVLKSINIYPPNQLMEGVDSLDEAKDIFDKVYKNRPNLGGGPVEGSFSKGSKGFIQQYEVKKGVLIYQDPVTGKSYTKTGEAIEFQHLIEGKATHTASDFADAADDFAKLIRDDIHAKDLRSMQKHLERIDDYLARGKQRVSGYHDDYIKNLIKKVENAEELSDDLLKEINHALKNIQFDTVLLKRMNDLKVSKAVPLLSRWQKLRLKAVEIMDQVPLDRFVSCVFTALDIYMSAEMMKSGNDEGAYRNLLAAGVSFVGFPPAILANMTNIIIDEMKVSGYSFVNSFQDCEDLLAGICQSTTEQKLEKTMDDVIYKYQPVTSQDFRETVGSTLQTNARDCVHKGFGPVGDKSDDAKETDLFDRCLADLYNKWKHRRLEIMGQVAEANVLFVKWLQGQIITLECTPDPIIITKKDGEFEETKATIKANIRLDQKQGEEIFKQMYDRIRILGGKKHVASVEAKIHYIWLVDGKQFHEDKDFYMGSGNFFDPDMLTVELPIKKDGTYDVGLKTVIDVKYISLIVSSDERYIPKGFDKFVGDVYGTVSGAVSSITGYGKKTQPADPNAKYYGDDVVSQGRDIFNLDQTVETYSSIKIKVQTEEKIEGSITIEGPDQLIKGEKSNYIAKLSPELDKRKDIYVNWYQDEVKMNADWSGKEMIVYAPKDKESIKYIVQVSTKSNDQISNITDLVSGIGKDKTKPTKEVNPIIAEATITIKLVDKSLKAEIEQAYKNKNYKKLIELLRACEKKDEKTLIQGYLKKLADEKYQTIKKYLDAMTAYQKAELAAYEAFHAKADAERKKYIASKDREGESKIAQCMNDAYNKHRKQKGFIESDIYHLNQVSEDYKNYQIDYPSESFFESCDNIQLGLDFDPSKPLKTTDYQLICSDKKAVEDDKKLNVIIKATKTSVKTGESVPVIAKVQYPQGSIMCPDEQDYIWQGNHAGSGDRVDFMATKSGSYTLSVTVKCMDRVIGSASKTFKVSGGGITGTIVGLEENQVYFGTKKEIKLKTDLIEKPKDTDCSSNPNNPFCVDTIHSGSIKQVSGSDTSPSSVYISDPSKEFEEPVDSRYKVLWQSNRGLTFLPQEIKGEGFSNFNTKVVFNRFENPTLIWAEIYEYKDGSYETIGESDQVEIEVVAPKFVMQFDPTQDKAKIGKDVKVDIIATPMVDEKLIDYRWVEPTDRLELEHGSISFKPKHGKPINFHVIARVPHHGDIIDDDIKDQYTAGDNIVIAKLIGPKFDKSSKEWSESQKGLVDVKRRLVTGQQIEASVTTEGVDADKVNYKWTSNEGCHIDSVDISDTVTVSRSEPGSCELTVVAYDKDKNRLGQDVLTFGIAQQDSGSVKDDKDKADKDKADKDKADKDKADKDKADKDKADKDKAQKDKEDQDKKDKEEKDRIEKEQKIKNAEDKIEKATTSGDFKSAEQAIEELSNSNPDDPVLGQLKDKISKAKDTYKGNKIAEAEAAVNKGNLEQAETILNEAKNNLPQEPEIETALTTVKANKTKINDLNQKFNEAMANGDYVKADNIVKEMSAVSRNNPATADARNKLIQMTNRGLSELHTKLNAVNELANAGDLDQAIINAEQLSKEAKNYKNTETFTYTTDRLLKELINKKSICDSAITEAKRLIDAGRYDEAKRIIDNAKLASRTYKPLVELSNTLNELKTAYDNKLKDLIDRANQALNACHYDQAVDLINQAKEIAPDNADLGRTAYDMNNKRTIFLQDLDRSKLYLDRGDIEFAKQELDKHKTYCSANDKFLAAQKRIDDYYAGKNSEILSKIAEIRALLNAKEYTKTVSLAKETRTTLHPTGENAVQINDMESAALKKINEQKGAINYINIVQTHLNQYNYDGCLSQLGVLDNQYPDCWEPSSEEPGRISKLRTECQTKSNRLNEILPIVKNAALNADVSMYDLGKANVLSDELVSLNPNQYDYGKYRNLIKQKMAKVSSAGTSSQGGGKTSIYNQWKNKKNGQSWGQKTPPPVNQGQSWGQTASTQPDRTPQSNNNFKDRELYNNGNIGGCGYTNTGTFTINKALNVSILEAYYHWKQGQTTEQFSLYKNGSLMGNGYFTKKLCSPGTSWCQGQNIFNKTLSPGQYTVKTADSRICQNSGTGGNGVIRIYSKDPNASSSDIAGSIKKVQPVITTSSSNNNNQFTDMWDMIANVIFRFDLNMIINGNTITGTMDHINGNDPTDQIKGRLNSNGTVEFQRIRPGSWVQNYTGKISGNKITGTFNHNGQGQYNWSATKKSGSVKPVPTPTTTLQPAQSSSGFDGKYSGTCRIYSGSGTCNVSMTVSNNQVSGSIIGIIEGDNVNASFTGAIIMPGAQYSQKSASVKATITKGTIMDHRNNRMERFTGSFSGTIYSSSKANGNLNFIITGQGNGPEGEWHVTKGGSSVSSVKSNTTPVKSTKGLNTPKFLTITFKNMSGSPIHYTGIVPQCSPSNKVMPGGVVRSSLKAAMSVNKFHIGRNGQIIGTVSIPLSSVSNHEQILLIYDSSGRFYWSK